MLTTRQAGTPTAFMGGCVRLPAGADGVGATFLACSIRVAESASSHG